MLVVVLVIVIVVLLIAVSPSSSYSKYHLKPISEGRSGKGSIFVWASGNGGRYSDSCNCDGYTNSIYTLSISSATEHGAVPWYSEACSSTLATTYSSGSGGERQIVTTDLRKDCTEYHTGTSASAPLAAGICALVLQANPSLTWRDMQHIVVQTARPANLKTSDWVINGMKRQVSHHFGFGLMDAGAMVERALNWTNVPQQHKCIIRANMEPSYRRIPANSVVSFPLESNGCHGTSEEVVYLEHVQAVVTLGASKRGQVKISLTSPAGTRSVLLARRSRDSSSDGFDNWAFMTTHNWGEMAFGKWHLEVSNSATSFYDARLISWKLELYGTATHPYRPTTPPPPPTTTPPPATQMSLRQIQASASYNQFQSWYQPNHIVHVGPCRKPQLPTPRIYYTPHPRIIHEQQLPPVINLESATTVGYPVLKNWSLVLYGTATHPQTGNNVQRHPVTTNQVPLHACFLLVGRQWSHDQADLVLAFSSVLSMSWPRRASSRGYNGTHLRPWFVPLSVNVHHFDLPYLSGDSRFWCHLRCSSVSAERLNPVKCRLLYDHEMSKILAVN
ncbi:hypothetical protein LSH36_107g13013 [Paralvinella palmiformis]|uniref:P/Homo B domain-containing protein n=1 Tax=Paralvinella palmiformis TaxID=53620 RepID=A0AAD9JZV5_9ANNE|nr:hypothetical protein LSH36_107g13013 [Paralvinella palmiformis]